MERVRVRIDGRLKQKLEAEARARGLTTAAIVRQILEEYLRQRTSPESCHDMAKRLGIIGSANGLPCDLSTNPEHMEGFGAD